MRLRHVHSKGGLKLPQIEDGNLPMRPREHDAIVLSGIAIQETLEAWVELGEIQNLDVTESLEAKSHRTPMLTGAVMPGNGVAIRTICEDVMVPDQICLEVCKVQNFNAVQGKVFQAEANDAPIGKRLPSHHVAMSAIAATSRDA